MTTIATLSVLVDADISRFTSGMTTVNNSIDTTARGMQNLGTSMQTVGQNTAAITLPIVAGLGLAVNAATEFDAAMTNVNSILQNGAEDAAALNAEILDIGSNSVAGPLAVADAYYEIVGGVADAANHIPILNAAIATSEAGAADLTATTNVLVGAMNAYGAGAEEATYYSDVLTATVAAGVGSMDSFAAAFPAITGVASSMGIEFDQLGGMMAYLTTRGTSAAEASTQLGGAMISLIRPSENMSVALSAIGFESGQAAVEALGLQGTYQALADAGFTNFAELTNGVEAMRGAIALTSEGASEFLANFATNIDGATAAARGVQLESASAQFSLLNSAVSGLAITLGQSLMLSLSDMATSLTPIVQGITNWAAANPELAGTIVAVVGGAALLGASMIVLGPLVSALGVALGVVMSPLFLVAGGFALLLSVTGEMPQFTEGLGQIVSGIVALASGDSEGLWEIGRGVQNLVTAAGDAVFDGIVGLGDAVIGIIASLTGTDLPTIAEGWAALGMGLDAAWQAIQIVMTSAQAGIQLFAATVQLAVATFIEDLRNAILEFTGGTIDIAPTISGDVVELTAQVETLTSLAINGAVGTGTANANVTLTASVDSSSAQATITAAVDSLGITSTGGFGGAPVAEVEGGGTVEVPSGATGVNVRGEGLMYVHANEKLLNAADTELYNNGGGGSGGGGGSQQNYYLTTYGTSPMEVFRMVQRAAKNAAPG